MIKNCFTKLYLCCIISSEAAWPLLNLTAAFSGPVYAVHTKNKNQGGYLICSVCGFIYDEAEGYADGGIAPGTKWEDVPDDFVCPLCGVGKDMFEKE